MQSDDAALAKKHMDMEQTSLWISNLTDSGLLALVEQNVDLRNGLQGGMAIDSIGNSAFRPASKGVVFHRSEPDYWGELKNEFRLLICTNDKKYSALRKELTTAASKSQTAMVSTIAAAMAARFGLVVGVLVPFCALCLMAVVRVGKEAFCAIKRP